MGGLLVRQHCRLALGAHTHNNSENPTKKKKLESAEPIAEGGKDLDMPATASYVCSRLDDGSRQRTWMHLAEEGMPCIWPASHLLAYTACGVWIRRGYTDFLFSA